MVTSPESQEQISQEGPAGEGVTGWRFVADCGLRSADSVARRRRSIRARVRDPIAHRLERREQAALELLADRSHPLLGTLGAALGLRELDLEVLELVGEFTANVAEALVRVAFGVKDALIRFAVDAFDARLGGGGVLSCARELRLQVTKLLFDFTACATEDVLGVGLGVDDAVIRLRLSPRDPCIGVGLCPCGIVPGSRQFLLHQSELLPRFGRLVSNALVDLPLDLADARISVGLNLEDGRPGVSAKS